MISPYFIVKKSMAAALSAAVVWVSGSVQAAALTASEISQIETEFGITLSAADQANLAAVVKPDAPFPVWRADAEARIETHRKATLAVQVVDSVGAPVPGAQVAVKLADSGFKFGGTFSAKDFSGVTLPGTMTTQQYKDRLLSMFNAVGLNNGFKPRLTGIHSYLPNVKSWAAENDLPMRGHLLIWPGVNDDSNHLTADVLADVKAIEAAMTNGSSQAVIDALRDNLKATVKTEMENWASQHDVYEWDVINEPLGNHRVQDALDDYDQMAEWFKIAQSNKVSADCKLLINEYQIISAMSDARRDGFYEARRDRYMTEIDRLLTNNAPLDRIGFQSRIKLERREPQLIYDRLEEWGNAYGLEMAGTEFEVVDSNPGDWMEYIYTDQERAEITEEMMTQYYSHPLVTGLHAWNVIHDENKALVDYSGAPTLNGLVWYYVHRIRYSTDASATSDLFGETTIPAFKGEYDITVSYGGNDYPATVTLASNQTLVVTLGDVAVAPGPVPDQAWVVLEEWDYSGLADGSVFTNGLSTTGSGLFWADKAPFAVVSNQMQRWEASGAVNESGFNDIGASPYANATMGVYQLSYDVVSADFSNTDAIGGKAQFGYGIRDSSLSGGDRNGVVLVRYEDTGDVNKFRLSVSAGSVVQQDIATGNSIADLHVRAVYDLDNAGSAGSFIGYFSIGAGPETAVTNTLASGFSLESLRMHIQALNGGNTWQPGDVVLIDNIILSERQLVVSPESYYTYWLSEYPGVVDTNLTGNSDGDIADNLLEYAFGGDPTNGLDIGYWPTSRLLNDGGGSYIEYVYTKRLDSAERGLAYTLELTPNLVSGVWTNAGYTVTGSSDVGTAYQSITNKVPVLNANEQFIRLQIGFQQ